MGKEIRFERTELVWQTRVVTFNKGDWERIKKWVKGYAERAEQNPKDSWYRTFVSAWEVIKDMSWDEAVEQYRKWRDDEQDAIYWTDHYYDGSEYKIYFGEWLTDEMREDVYNADIYNEDYADDSSEDIEILENDEEDEEDED